MIKRRYTEEEANERRQHLKNQLTATALPVLGLAPGLGAAYGTAAFLRDVAKYPAMNTGLGTNITNKVIYEHMQATGAGYPNIVNPTSEMGARAQEGAYVSRYLTKLASKLPEDSVFKKAIGTGTGGTVVIKPTADVYRLAHELGHRAQDYHPVAGPIQNIGNIAAGLPIGELATAIVSSKAETNRGAIAKGLLTQYAIHAPRIISEIVANKLGSNYLRSAGVSGMEETSMLQPIGYALAPAAAAVLPIAAGRLAKTVAQKWKRSKENKQQEEQVQPPIIY